MSTRGCSRMELLPCPSWRSVTLPWADSRPGSGRRELGAAAQRQPGALARAVPAEGEVAGVDGGPRPERAHRGIGDTVDVERRRGRGGLERGPEGGGVVTGLLEGDIGAGVP